MKFHTFKLLLPILWIVFGVLAVVFGELLGGILFVLLVPSIVFVGAIQRSLYDPSDIAHRDVTLFVFAASIIQAFLLGCLLDALLMIIRRRKERP